MAVSPHEVRQRDGVYRRGVLLGMTMAEIMILLLFCLLMAFVLRLEEYQAEIKDYQAQIKESQKGKELVEALQKLAGSYDDAWEMLSSLETLLSKIGTEVLSEIAALVENDRTSRPEDITAAIKSGLKQYGQIKQELSSTQNLPPSPADVISAMDERMNAGKELQPQLPYSHVLEFLMREFRDENGQVPSPVHLKEALGKALAEAAVWKAGNQGDLAQGYQEAIAQNNQMKQRIGRLDRALANATDQLAGKGQGLEYPSCFVTPDGEIQYVFEVVFDEQALNLTPLPVPGNEEQWEGLQFNRISTGEGIPVKRYLAETKDVFEWSISNACRFFVRIIDQTLAENKKQYKSMRLNIEQRFYIKEVAQPLSAMTESAGSGS